MKDYYKNSSTSQSRLKTILTHPKIYKNYDLINKNSDDKKHIVIGKLVDYLITSTSSEDISDKYRICQASVPTGQLLIFSNEYVKAVNSGIENPKEHAFIALEAQNGGPVRGGFQSINERFEESCSGYVSELLEQDKILITQQDFILAKKIAASLKNSPFINKWITPTNKIEILFQLEIYWKLGKREHDLKSLLDFVIINHELKTVRVGDLKTTGDSVNKFVSSILRYRYDFQMAFYCAALKYYISENRPDIADYTFEYPIFIVESTDEKYIGTPLIYEIGNSWLTLGSEGGVYEGKKYKGFLEALDLLEYHITSNQWDYRKEDFENEGIIRL
jgi:hypothetical protein